MEKSLIKGTDSKYLRRVEIYTGGSCCNNPGPGGYAAILACNKTSRKISGKEPYTTSTRMVMTAAIEALTSLKYPSAVNIYSDNEHIIKGMNEWLGLWKQRGWITSKGKPVANIHLWKILERATKRHCVRFIGINDTNRNQYNKQAQDLAKKEMNKMIESYA